MTTTLIVLAHPDSRSFNSTWAEATESASRALGHKVLWSNLHTMGFDPVETARHYKFDNVDLAFDPLKFQERASTECVLPPDVAEEIRKVRSADRIIFHFPLWWFSPPAILKGWFDRVLAHGALHTVAERFDSGMCRGKKALFCVTTGSSETESAFNGKEGDVGLLLWPAAYTLRYLGFTVLTPRTVHGVHGYHKAVSKVALETRLNEVLSAQSDLVERFDERPVLAFNSDTDFDQTGRLRTDRPTYSQFIRQIP